MIVVFVFTHYRLQIVATVSGDTRVGDTRGGNSGCHPSIFPEKPGDFFRESLSLFIAFTRVSPLPPRGCRPAPFLPLRPRFSTILCKFAHKKIFFGCQPPWRVSPGAVPRSSPSDATGRWIRPERKRRPLSITQRPLTQYLPL